MKQIILLLLLCSLCGCKVFRQNSETVKSFNFCYKEKHTGIDTLIGVSGFYYKESDERNGVLTKEGFNTIYPVYMFFKNGFFIYNPSIELYTTHSNHENVTGNVGLYVIHGDTIKAQFVEPLYNMSWNKGEVWFKIIDSNTLEALYFKYYDSVTAKEVIDFNKTNNRKSFYKFKPLEVIPNTDKSWIMKEKWFWCNEEDYYRFKKSIKGK